MATPSEEKWKLRYDPRVRKQLQKLRNKAVVRKLQQATKKLEERPYSSKSLGGYSGIFSKRVGTPDGEYRIVYCPIKQDRVIFVLLIGPREQVYDVLKQKDF